MYNLNKIYVYLHEDFLDYRDYNIFYEQHFLMYFMYMHCISCTQQQSEKWDRIKLKAPLWKKPDYYTNKHPHVFNTILLFVLLSFVVEVYGNKTKEKKKLEYNSIAEVWDNLFKSTN